MPSTSYRIPESLNARLEAAASEQGTFRSELTRRALRYYISENPDDIRVFTPKSARDPIGAPTDQEGDQEGGEGDEPGGGASDGQETDQEGGEGDEPDLDQSRDRGGAPTDQEGDQEGGEGDESDLDEVQGVMGGEPYCPTDEFE